MGSVNPPKKRDYSDKTRIDLNQSYQVAYWKERFGVSEQELCEAVLAHGCLKSLGPNAEDGTRSRHRCAEGRDKNRGCRYPIHGSFRIVAARRRSLRLNPDLRPRPRDRARRARVAPQP